MLLLPVAPLYVIQTDRHHHMMNPTTLILVQDIVRGSERCSRILSMIVRAPQRVLRSERLDIRNSVRHDVHRYSPPSSLMCLNYSRQQRTVETYLDGFQELDIKEFKRKANLPIRGKNVPILTWYSNLVAHGQDYGVFIPPGAQLQKA